MTESEKTRIELEMCFDEIDKISKLPKNPIHTSIISSLEEKIECLARYCDMQNDARVASIITKNYSKKRKLRPCEDNYLSVLSKCGDIEAEVLEVLFPKPKTGTRISIEPAIKNLPPRQREILRMYSDGVTYSGIAHITNTKKGSVSKNIQISKNKFKDGIQLGIVFEEEEEEDR